MELQRITVDSLIIAHYVAFARPLALRESPYCAAVNIEQNRPGLLALVERDLPARVANGSYLRARAEMPAHQYEWLANDFHARHNFPATVIGSAEHAH